MAGSAEFSADQPAPIRVRPRAPADLLDTNGRPSVAGIKARASRTINDPAVDSFGPWRPVLRTALRWAKVDAGMEAERAALPPVARACRDRIDGLIAQHDALYYAPGWFAATEAERAGIRARIAAERRAEIVATLASARRALSPGAALVDVGGEVVALRSEREAA